MEKDLGVQIDNTLNMSQQWALAASRVSPVPGHIRQGTASWLREGSTVCGLGHHNVRWI